MRLPILQLDPVQFIDLFLSYAQPLISKTNEGLLFMQLLHLSYCSWNNDI